MTQRDARRGFLAASGGFGTLAFAGCPSDGDDGRECPAVEDVVQVTVTPT